MADWGLLSALSGVNNWNAIRQEKQRELQTIAIRNAMMQDELSRQQQAGAAVEDYMQTISKIKTLEPDMERIKAKNQELVASIQEGIKKSDGNVKKYLLSGGINALNKYKQTLIDSEEVQTGLLNAYNHNRYLADLQAGLTPRGVSWTDENGQQVQGDYATQFNAYNNGKIKRLSYYGGYKMPKFDEKVFTEFYGNKDRTYKGVSVDDYYRSAYDQFADLNPQDRADAARYHTMNYASRLKNGATPLHWKFDDPLKRQESLARIGYYNAKTAALKAPQENVNWYNLMYNSNQRQTPYILADNANAPTAVKTPVGDGVIYNYNLPENFSSTIAKAQGYNLDKGQVVNKGALLATNNFFSPTGEKYDLSGVDANNIINAEPLPYIIDLNVGGKNVVKGMAYKLTINEKGAEKVGVDGQPLEGFWSNKPVYGVKKIRGDKGQGDAVLGMFNWDQFYDSNDHSYEVTVVQPLSPSAQSHFAVNKGIGITSKFNKGEMGEDFGYQNAQLFQGVFDEMSGALDEE